MGVRVQISARLIRWPTVCACCTGRADDVYRTTHTRVTGTRVVRTNSRWWDVPYCSACLDHVDAHSRARSVTAAGSTAALVGGIVLGLAVTSFGACCCGPGVFAPPRAAGDNQGPVQAGAVIITLGSLLLGAGVAVGGYLWSRKLEADARQRRRQAVRYAESLASRCCRTLDAAVEYNGWHGSVHTFWFANPQYADAFVRANPGKVLWG